MYTQKVTYTIVYRKQETHGQAYAFSMEEQRHTKVTHWEVMST